jgi:hypothetical protein
MTAYEDARSRLPASALAIADELIALAPPLAGSVRRQVQRALGPCVPPLTAQDARMTQAQAARTAA